MKSKLAIFTLSFATMIGCTSPPTMEEANAEFCTDLATLRQNMASLTAISPDSTVGQLKDAKAAVTESFRDVKDSAAQMQTIRIDKLEQAHEDLDRAINNISNNDRISEALASVQPAIAEVQAAEEELHAGAACQ